MKTLKTLQTLSKIGKVLSKIVFILSIVGFAFCIVGIISLALGGKTISFNGVTIEGMIQAGGEITLGTMYASMAVAMVYCAAEAVVSKFAELYFENELKAGTPFTVKGAKEMRRLGIINIIAAVSSGIISGIVYICIKNNFVGTGELSLDSGISFGMSFAFIVVSLILQSAAEGGAEVKSGENGEEKKEENKITYSSDDVFIG